MEFDEKKNFKNSMNEEKKEQKENCHPMEKGF